MAKRSVIKQQRKEAVNFSSMTYDNENNILLHYRGSDSLILSFPEGDEIIDIYESTHNEKEWKAWVDSAGKADKTPDFYSDKHQMMMEVMRFDDKAFRKGKRNPTLERERSMLRELEEKGIMETFPDINQIFLNADTQLPTDEDHNFTRYRDNFVRIVGKHSKQVEIYKNNHPGYKLLFFVFDETSGIYYQKISDREVTYHKYWADSVIIKSIKDSGADFIIWYKPYNYYETSEGMKGGLPQLMIYDIANMQIKVEDYNICDMISSEV
ncbi:hypothetical protein [Lacrimispora sp.]|uniref:hypothetical protein n=1 Tax=Lacrimispora sp. TaxID=2719234 RepID=UPI0028A6B65D|nr:hypothetical protein [Lacrimispora sp.]